LVAAAKFLVAATKKLFVVSNFVAVTKPFFSVADDKLCRKVAKRAQTYKNAYATRVICVRCSCLPLHLRQSFAAESLTEQYDI